MAAGTRHASIDRAAVRRVCAAAAGALSCSLIVQGASQQPVRETPQAVAGAQEAVALEPGRAIERELAGKQSHLYTLALNADEYASITVEQRGIDVVVQVLDGEGQTVADFDSVVTVQGQERAGIVAQAAGSYRLRVAATYARSQAGRYQIRLGERRPAAESDRALFEAHKLTTQSVALDNGGKYDEADRLAARALELGEQAAGPNDAYVGYLLTRLAELERTRGNTDRAEQLFKRAVAVNESALGREQPQTAYSLLRLAALHNARDDYAQAEPLLREALDITVKTLGAEHPRVVTCLMNLAVLHVDREDHAVALSELQRALAIAEKVFEPDDFGLIAVVHNLGDVYIWMRDFDRGAIYTERALHAIEAKFGPEHPRVVPPLMNLAIVARERTQYAWALELLSRAVAIREKTLGARHPQTASLLIVVGNVHRAAGDYAKALDFYQRARDILEASVGPYHSLTLLTLTNPAIAYAAQGDAARALEYQTRADEIVEKGIELNLAVGSERERLMYLRATSERTDRTISLHVRQAPDDTRAAELAALVLLQRKGRVLDAMSGSVAAQRHKMSGKDLAVLDQLGATTAALAKLALGGPGKTPPDEYRRQLAELEDKRERLERDISGNNTEFRAQRQPVTVASVRATIPPEAALIELAIYRPFDPEAPSNTQAYGAPRYVAYILRQQDDVRWKDLGPAKDVDDAVAALRNALRDPSRADVRELARRADARIMAPIRAVLGGATRLLISPDGALHLIPFETLVDEDGRFAIERYSISYLTAGRDLLRMQVARQSRSAPLVIADPLFGEPDAGPASAGGRRAPVAAARLAKRQSVVTADDLSSVYFAPLAGTASEARAIKALFPEANVLTGPNASKAALAKVDAPLILHIATHGFFLNDAARETAAPANAAGIRAVSGAAGIDNPLLRSGLALAGANVNRAGHDNGILTALEASSLNLWGTKLVTLSACETGVGEIRDGEGVYGLRRAFFLAGAETLVMSLWPVSDLVTREMMASYYGGLKNGLGRGEALRAAQLAMLKRDSRKHPFYWASFIQAGDWTGLDDRP